MNSQTIQPINYDHWCRRCANKVFSDNLGILCGLTNEKPAFVNDCADFAYDPQRDQSLGNEGVRDKRIRGRALWTGVGQTVMGILISILPSMIIGLDGQDRWASTRHGHGTGAVRLAWRNEGLYAEQRVNRRGGRRIDAFGSSREKVPPRQQAASTHRQ